MKRIALLVLLFLVQVSLHAQQLFNNDWRFHKGDLPDEQRAATGTAGWLNVTLPHDWSIEGPFSEEWASATGFLPGGIGWYKKEFTTQKDWQNKQVFIYFDGVYKNSTVWLNGHLLGNRPNGFIPFQYELTKYLQPGGRNVLVVKVDHSEFADSRWYTGSGIYRNVYLTVKEAVHIPAWGVQFTTPRITRAEASAITQVAVKNKSQKAATITIQTHLTDSTGKTVSGGSRQVTIKAYDSALSMLRFTIPNPHLWSAHDPALYRLTVDVISNGKTMDRYTENVGIRSLRFDADSGFFLNNQNLKLKGVCLHDDAGALGVAVPAAVWRSRLQTLKDLGCNSIRMSHNPHADYFYNLCDEMGFLVIDEAFDEWETGKNKWIKGWNVGTPGKDGYHESFKDWANIDVREMVLRNYNHPSIIAWSIGNEIDYPNDPYSHPVLDSGRNPQIYGRGYLPDHPPASRLGELSQQLASVVKQIDTTRPVTAALAGVVMSNTTTYPDNLDWVGYNYQEYRYADDHATYPNRIIHGSENGMALGNWQAADTNQYISAQYLWTGIDYLGEAGKWPQRSNGAGLIDLAGNRKPEYYFRQSLWSDEPMIYIGATKAPNEEDKNIWRHLRAEDTWNWQTGDTLRVNCFTNCNEAELFVNGKSLGKKRMAAAANRILYWTVWYEPGEVKVIGFKNGKTVVSDVLHTAGAPKALSAKVEKDTTGQTGLVQVRISIVDENGIVVPSADNDVTFAVSSGATLLGLESASHTSHEDYKANHRKTKNGKLLGYVMKKDYKAPASVTISAEGLTPVTVGL